MKVTGYKDFSGVIPEQEVVYGKDTVYVHENIMKLEPVTDVDGEEITNENMYSYDETQYTYMEWAVMQDEVIQTTREELAVTELALMEIYEAF